MSSILPASKILYSYLPKAMAKTILHKGYKAMKRLQVVIQKYLKQDRVSDQRKTV
jgi:hypothetical protein